MISSYVTLLLHGRHYPISRSMYWIPLLPSLGWHSMALVVAQQDCPNYCTLRWITVSSPIILFTTHYVPKRCTTMLPKSSNQLTGSYHRQSPVIFSSFGLWFFRTKFCSKKNLSVLSSPGESANLIMAPLMWYATYSILSQFRTWPKSGSFGLEFPNTK